MKDPCALGRLRARLPGRACAALWSPLTDGPGGGPDEPDDVEFEVRGFPPEVREASERYAARWRPLLEGDGLHPLCELPVFYSQEECASLTADLRAVHDAALALVKSAWESGGANGLSTLCGAALDARPDLVSGPPADWGLMRPDLIRSADGPKLLELNVSTGVVGASHPFLVEYFSGHPLTQFLSARWDVSFPDYFEGLAAALKARLTGRRGALLEFKDGAGHLGTVEASRAVRFLKKYGLELPIADLTGQTLRVTPAGVTVRGERVDLVFCHFIPQYFFAGSGILDDLVRASRDGLVELVGAPSDVALFSKLLLPALLLRPPAAAGPAASSALSRLLPGTFRTVDAAGDADPRTLRRSALGARERFVLKWGMGYSSEQVLIGRLCEPARWRDAVETAFRAGDWVLQEFVRAQPSIAPGFLDGRMVSFAHAAVESPFIVEGGFRGMHLRCSGFLCDGSGAPAAGGDRLLSAGIGAVLSPRAL